MQSSWPLPPPVGPVQVIADRYRLQNSLGSGSLGEVFLALDLEQKPPHPVALKLLHPHLLQDEAATKELQQEATVARQLSHPHILQVLDSKVSPEQAFIVTEYLPGGSLADLLHPDPDAPFTRLSLSQVNVYLEQIAKALDYAHSRGLVHRDLKPANILLDANGNALLADFSLAVNSHGLDVTRLLSAEAWGTPLYASPEQWNDLVGKTSDIYALGILTYELLTGYTPYEGTKEELKDKHLHAPVPRLREKAPDLDYPAALDGVLAKAMAKDPADRPASAMEFYRNFREVVGNAAPVSKLQNVGWSNGSAVMPWPNGSTALPGLASKPAQTPSFYSSPTWQATATSNPGNLNPATSANSGKASKPIGWFSIIVLVVTVVGGIYTLMGGFKKSSTTTYNYTYSPPASSSSTPTVAVSVNRTADGTQVLRGHSDGVTSLTPFGKSGLFFYSGSNDGTVRSWTNVGGDAISIKNPVQIEKGNVTQIALSPDGTIFATATSEYALKLYNNQDKVINRAESIFNRINSLSWSPNSEFLLGGLTNSKAIVWDRLGRVKLTLEGSVSSVNAVAWSPDGSRFVTAWADGLLKIWSLDGTLLASLKDHTKGVNAVAWSSDGGRFASAGEDNTIRVWGKNGEALKTFASDRVLSLAWSPVGDQIAAGGNSNITLWKTDGSLIKVLVGHTDTVTCLLWHDTQTLISGSQDKTVRIWQPGASLNPFLTTPNSTTTSPTIKP